MIQDLNGLTFDNQYSNKSAKDRDVVMLFEGKNILVKFQNNCETEDNNVIFPSVIDTGIDREKLVYLYQLGDISYYMPFEETDRTSAIEIMKEKGYEFIKMFELRSVSPKEAIFAGATAFHLYTWYSGNTFCGKCGKKLMHDEKERMLKCICGHMVFPKIIPAVIVGVRNGDKLLMTKYQGREYTRYALIAGFTEIGESVEETVAREVFEEAGIKVKNITYYKTQPWGFDSDLLLGYFCDVDGDDTITMDESELSVAQWVDYRDMPVYNEGLSLTEEMMNYFREKKMYEA